jgi:hypothetical protein
METPCSFLEADLDGSLLHPTAGGAGMVMLNATSPGYFHGLIAIDPVGTPIEQCTCSRGPP